MSELVKLDIIQESYLKEFYPEENIAFPGLIVLATYINGATEYITDPHLVFTQTDVPGTYTCTVYKDKNNLNVSTSFEYSVISYNSVQSNSNSAISLAVVFCSTPCTSSITKSIQCLDCDSSYTTTCTTCNSTSTCGSSSNNTCTTCNSTTVCGSSSSGICTSCEEIDNCNTSIGMCTSCSDSLCTTNQDGCTGCSDVTTCAASKSCTGCSDVTECGSSAKGCTSCDDVTVCGSSGSCTGCSDVTTCSSSSSCTTAQQQCTTDVSVCSTSVQVCLTTISTCTSTQQQCSSTISKCTTNLYEKGCTGCSDISSCSTSSDCSSASELGCSCASRKICSCTGAGLSGCVACPTSGSYTEKDVNMEATIDGILTQVDNIDSASFNSKNYGVGIEYFYSNNKSTASSTAITTFSSLSELTLTELDSIQVDYYVLSESGCDKLNISFEIDGESIASTGDISGYIKSRATFSFNVPESCIGKKVSELKIICKYSKDSSVNGGADQAWIRKPSVHHAIDKEKYRDIYFDQVENDEKYYFEKVIYKVTDN